jgi:N-methylhydantoinase A/oxoprolinase/acetone carboxylase beta subunit
MVNEAIDLIHRKVAEGVDRMKTSQREAPLILVGGGAILINRPIPGTSKLIVPDFASVANAIGAAIAQVGGEIDRVFSYAKTGREAALAEARAIARQAAVAAGAVPETVQILESEEIPLAYVPGGAVRVRVRAAGDLAIAKRPPSPTTGTVASSG